MADRQLVLCDLLCFLVNKFGKVESNVLKSVILDFYMPVDIMQAKDRLYEELLSLSVDNLIPITGKHVGEAGAAREFDDILTLLQFANDKKYFEKLPRYVAGSPDSMPSSTQLHLVSRLNNLEEKFSGVCDAILCEVYGLRQSLSRPGGGSSVACERAPRQPAGTRGDINKQPSSHSGEPAEASGKQTAEAAVVLPVMTSHGGSGARPFTDVAASVDDVASNRLESNCSQQRSETLWSALTSTPQGYNRFAALASTDDDDRDDQPFITVRSQRAARSAAKRQREVSAAQVAHQSSQPTGRQKSRVITGQSSAISLNLKAAKKTIKKAVFCVDNVHLACNEDDIRAYVSSLGAQVFSCFKVKPRRRPTETADDVLDRRAFRLCVNADDRERLLNPDVWPDSVRISDWFFRDKNNQPDNDGKRARIDGTGQRRATVPSRDSAGAGGSGTDNNTLNVCGAKATQRETIAAAAATASVAATVEPMETVNVVQAVASEVRNGKDGDTDVDATLQYLVPDDASQQDNRAD